MKTSDKYLVKASKVIESTGLAQNNRIPKAYKGAVSSFGASLIMNGLIPTIQFFMADSSNRAYDSKIIIEAIARIIYDDKVTGAGGMKSKIMDLLKTGDPKTRRIKINNMKKKVIDAAIALKIMMRSYEFSDEDSDRLT